MKADQRRAEIAALLKDTPDASSRSIAKAIGCSQATVVRDIAWLRGDSVIHLVNQVEGRGVSTTFAARAAQVNQPGRGDTLVERLRAEMKEQGLIPTSTEEELLAVAHDLADRIELLQGVVAEDGERLLLKGGRAVMHPALAEIRQCESTLSRVLAGIQTMEQPQVNRTKQRAAQARWRTKNRQRGLTEAETPVGHG